MADSLLTIVRNVCDLVGLTRPTTVIGATNEASRQLLAATRAEGRYLVRRYPWQKLRKERTFTATGGSEEFVFPTDFDRLVPNSFWNRTENEQVTGPITAQEWQAIKSAAVNPIIREVFAIRGGSMWVYPAPAADHEYYYEYISTRWCGGAASTEPTQTEFALDTDIQYFDDELFTLGVAYRYKRSRGMDFADDLQDYEIRLIKLIDAEAPMPVLSMSTAPKFKPRSPTPPDGDWVL